MDVAVVQGHFLDVLFEAMCLESSWMRKGGEVWKQRKLKGGKERKRRNREAERGEQ